VHYSGTPNSALLSNELQKLTNKETQEVIGSASSYQLDSMADVIDSEGYTRITSVHGDIQKLRAWTLIKGV
jgi:hypothetical protein